MKKIFLVLLILFGLATFTSCGSKPVAYKEGENYKIVVIEDEIRDFIKKSKEDEGHIKNYYNEIVKRTIFKTFDYKGEYISILPSLIGTPVTNISEYEKDLNKLLKSNVVEIAEKALQNSISHLNEDGVTTELYILPENPDGEGHPGGVNALTVGQGKIIMLIDPEYEGWEDTLEFLIAHEYHHNFLVHQMNKRGESPMHYMLKYILMEGRADSFAHILYPDYYVSWDTKLENEKEIWEKLQPDLSRADYGFQFTVMEGDEINYPDHTGYRLGYSIVQCFLKNNSDVSILDWTNMSPEELLKKSGFENQL